MDDIQPVAFFDIGQTLGVARVTADFRLEGLDVYPYIPKILDELQREGIRLGIISNTGSETRATLDAVLAAAGIDHYFADSPELLLYSSEVKLTKSSPQIFSLAAHRAGLHESPERCTFVGEDSSERYFALQADLRVAPHPELALDASRGEPLRYIRFRPPAAAGGGWRSNLKSVKIVPLAVSGRVDAQVLAIATARAASQLDDLGFAVDRLGAEGLPATTELYLVRDDRQTLTGFMNPGGESTTFFGAGRPSSWVLASGSDGILVALPALRSIEEVHFEGAAHGHNSKLLPDFAILTPFGEGAGYRSAGWLAGCGAVRDRTLAEPILPPEVLAALQQITPEAVQAIVNRYSGQAPLLGDAATTIKSRHIHSEDNRLAVRSLILELESLSTAGLVTRAHAFVHEGQTFYNVEAELAGQPRVGESESEVVVISAHLDSTAAFSDHAYNPRTDPAPGADDDASGVAAVLAIAKAFCGLPAEHRPLRTLRFLLFNAEEHGLVGSRAYARDQAAIGAPIVAVFQMDMIGYIGANVTLPRPYELHAGFPGDADVEQRSLTLAKRVQTQGAVVGVRITGEAGLQTGQLYRDGDPAAGRSDHASFQERGYAACVISEDFFAGPDLNSPAPQGNGNYHKDTDSAIAADYLSDIARTVAAAAFITAALPRNELQPARSFGGPAVETRFDARDKVYERLAKQPGQADRLSARLFELQRLADNPPQRSAMGAAVEVRDVNPFTMSARSLTIAKGYRNVPSANRISEALQLLNQFNRSAGFGDAEFVPDPTVQSTSGLASVVNLHQHYQGVPIFQMTRTVRFAAQSTEIVGENVLIEDGNVTIRPVIAAGAACVVAAKYLAEAHGSAAPPQSWGPSKVAPVKLDVENYAPAVEIAFGLPAQPCVLSAGPFAQAVPAHLVMFYMGLNDAGKQDLRLSWQLVFTLPKNQGQYRAIVAADRETSELLYLQPITHAMANAAASSVKAKVYRSNPRTNRADVAFPLPLDEYPLDRAGMNLPTAFPFPWAAADTCQGASTRAVRGDTSKTFKGVADGAGGVVFKPSDATGNDQEVLNIFYYCCYMHDFFYMLGFDEAAGNFAGNDPVIARAHPEDVWGTANMSTPPDGESPVMNMGLVTATDRHTAFDADVVFHEFCHGVTNRLVGGRLNVTALEGVQSGGMGEGWGDYFALTIQNIDQATERVVTGDWVIKDSRGIRNFPYDDDFPLTFGDLGKVKKVDGRNIDLTEVHNIGEVWCACLMHLHRKLEAVLNNKRRAYQLGWQVVVDSLKLMPANPNFLDARDSMLRALRDKRDGGTLSASDHFLCCGAMWEAFAGFGMGANARSIGASVVGVEGDDTIPSDPEVPTSLRGTAVNRLHLLAGAAYGDPSKAEVRKLAAAWEQLPEATRARILGIVEGATID